jgi:hypothetical protein
VSALLILLLLAGLGLAAAGAAAARAATPLKTVRYRGAKLEVPRGWPVFHLAAAPSTCVRFDRHAVYLGQPGAAQVCPEQPAGRTETILVQPLVGGAGPQVGADMPSGSSLRVVQRDRGVVITATWNRDPATIRQALGIRSLAPLARASQPHPPAAPAARGRTRSYTTRASATTTPPATPGEVYTGRGFDACSAPSTTTMSDWNASPYRAIGIYIGGAERACSEPNLTATWTSQEAAAGWHLIPIYVGLQPPGSSCCTSFPAADAAGDGAAAAADAVTQAQAIGLGPGNPIYFDQEPYTRDASNSSAALSFLEAWTKGLHADGYLSGVYASESSGVPDLVSEVGTGYTEPDDLWIANWNNQQTTSDPNVPAADWSDHQRLHQYEGGYNQTYGGATLNIDGDYLDSATAASGSAAGSDPVPPVAAKPPAIRGAPLVGQTLTEIHGRWSGSPTSFSYQWEDCAPAGTACTAIPGATGPTYTEASTDVGHALRVVEAAIGPGGSGIPDSSAATGIVTASPTSGYWLSTAYGNIFNSPGASFYGSAILRRLSTITGMAATRNGRGYWLTESSGQVLAFGNAPRFPAPRTAHPVRGIAGDPGGSGYWQYTAYGTVMANRGSRFYGSPSWAHVSTSTITGMAATSDGRGYWLVQASGKVFAYGDAKSFSIPRVVHPIIGIVRDPAGHGYWLFTAEGNVLAVGGAVSYGSAAPASGIVAMASTPDGGGYWLVSAGGRIYPFGDAASFRAPGHSHPITGIVTS